MCNVHECGECNDEYMCNVHECDECGECDCGACNDEYMSVMCMSVVSVIAARTFCHECDE